MANELDRMIDSALAERVGAEPPWGMEGRILRRVRMEQPRHRLFYWLFARATAFAMLAIFLLLLPKPETPLPPVVKARIPIPRLAVMPAPPRTRHRQVRLKSLSTPHYSAQEIALSDAVRRYPKEMSEALADLKSKASAPIEIAALWVKPIQIESLSEEENQ